MFLFKLAVDLLFPIFNHFSIISYSKYFSRIITHCKDVDTKALGKSQAGEITFQQDHQCCFIVSDRLFFFVCIKISVMDLQLDLDSYIILPLLFCRHCTQAFKTLLTK